MTPSIDLENLRVSPGPGFVVVGDHAVVVLAGHTLPDLESLARVLAAADDPRPSDALATVHGLDGPFALWCEDTDGHLVVRHGDITVTGDPTSRPAGAGTELRPRPDIRYEIGTFDAGRAVGAARGVWAATGVSIGTETAAAAAPAKAWWASVDLEPASGDLEPGSIDLATKATNDRPPMPIEPAPSPDDETDDGSLPIVEGILCPRGHLVNPVARFCHVDGLSLENISRLITKGPRLPFAALSLGGTQHVLTRDAVIGRAPEEDPRVQAGQAIPVAIPDPHNVISRAHTFIRLDGWRITASDCGSKLGTFVRTSESAPWTPLDPRQEHELLDGTTLRIGDAELRLARFDVR